MLFRSSFSPLLITLLIALPAAAVVTYINMPEPFDNLWSSLTNHQESNPDQNISSAPTGQNTPQALSQLPFQPSTSTFNSNNRAVGDWQQPSEPEWVIQQRAEMEKRRAEYEKEFQNRNSGNNFQASNQPPEPPQWVKDRQAEIEKQVAQHQEQWKNQQANWARSNRAPEPPAYMRHPQVNMNQPYPANMANQAPPQTQSAPNPGYGYQQRVQNYNRNNYQPNPYFYNRPNYGYGPYNAPYGWNGYPR